MSADEGKWTTAFQNWAANAIPWIFLAGERDLETANLAVLSLAKPKTEAQFAEAVARSRHLIEEVLRDRGPNARDGLKDELPPELENLVRAAEVQIL